MRKVRSLEGREYTEDSQEEECPHQLAGEESAHGKHRRCPRDNNAHLQSEIGWRAK
jgi:hypothetical protein